MDWVANNIYWADAVWARIEVADINGMYRRELLRVGANTSPRGIAVDPERRYTINNSAIDSCVRLLCF